MEKPIVFTLPRREFLKQAALVTAAQHPALGLLAAAANPEKSGCNPHVYYLIRPMDLVCLRFEFTNCWMFLGWLHAKKGARVTIRLPQQHLVEQSIDPSTLNGGIVTRRIDLAGYSYLEFNLRRGLIAFNPDKWLNWDCGARHSLFPEMLGVHAPGKNQAPTGLPDPNTITRLEFPYGLWLAPVTNPVAPTVDGVFSWDHYRKLKDTVYDDRNELWTSRLKVTLPGTSGPTDPAFWMTRFLNRKAGAQNCHPPTPDFDADALPTNCDLDQLQKQANLGRAEDIPYDQLVRTNKSTFEISSLGTTTKLLYKPGYPPSVPSKIVEWKQETSLGSDNYIEVVTSGWIFPYMIRCDFARVTRKVTIIKYHDPNPSPQTLEILVAKFRRSQPGVVYEDVLKISQNPGSKAARRGIPFTGVKLLTAESPEFSFSANFIQLNPDANGKPQEIQGIVQDSPAPFWTVTNFTLQQYYAFEFEGTDHNGTAVRFSSPFIFIPDPLPANACRMDTHGGNALDMDTIGKHFRAKTIGDIDWGAPPLPAPDGTNKVIEAAFENRNRAQTNNIINFLCTYNDGAPPPAALEPLRESVGSLNTEYFVFNSWPLQKDGMPTFNQYNPVDKNAGGLVPFFPILDYANVVYPPLQELLSSGGPGTMPQCLTFPVVYLVNGIFGAYQAKGILNQPKVFLKMVDTALPLFNGTTMGALLRPTMKAAAISLANGIVSTAADVLTEDLASALNSDTFASPFMTAIQKYIGQSSAPTFDPKEFLPAMTILGQDIGLVDLIDQTPIGDFINEASQFMPIIQSIRDLASTTVTAEFKWTVKNDQLKSIQGFFEWLYDQNGQDSSLTVDITETVSLASATTKTSCTLQNFSIDLLDFITVYFSSLEYTYSTSGGSHVAVKITDVEFGGSLSFINLLASLLQSLDDALQIAELAAEIVISYDFSLPTISMPCFTLANIKISPEVHLSLDVSSSYFTFAFNKVQDPFTLSVAIFGGGGSVRSNVDFRTSGIIDFGASFEFGGYFGLDIVVADGCVYLFAGVYFDFDGKGCIILGAYIRCGGEVDVLDLITVSVTFYLDLQYQDNDNQTLLTGTCTITASISIAFFSIDVPLTFRKDLAGSAAGTHAQIARDCSGSDTTMAVLPDGALAGPNVGDGWSLDDGYDDPVPPANLPPPPLDGKAFTNKKFSVKEQQSPEEWLEYYHAFA